MYKKTQTELFCDWLDNYLNYEQIPKKGEFSLETMKFLVDRFKHPENTFKSIHVAGSKGKGSVSTMLANIIHSSGIPAGLYTSPHMIDFSERVSSAEGCFSDDIYGKACDIVVPLIDSIIPGSIPGMIEPTWFELVTLFAFVTFREAHIPWAVIETGLGGRLDATNVISPLACVLTPIELEHTEYLGDTIEKIALEKAGIIKKETPVFISEQRNSVRSVFERTALEHNCPLFSMEDAIQSISSKLVSEFLEVNITFNALKGGPVFTRPLQTKLRLVSEVQAKNAALAAFAAKYLFPDISESVIETGLSQAWLPGRFEIISGDNEHNSTIVLDGAHTVNSIKYTLDTFQKLFPGTGHLLFACAADKDVDSISALFLRGFSLIRLTRPGNKKSSDIGHAEKAFHHIFAGHADATVITVYDFKEAIENAIKDSLEAKVPLLVTGSFYLVSEVKKILANRIRDPEK